MTRQGKITRIAGVWAALILLMSLPAAAGVRLQGLDRTTARTSTFEVKTGQSVFFGRLEIILRHCKKSEPTEPLENTAFLEIYEYLLTEPAKIAQNLAEAHAQDIANGLSEDALEEAKIERQKQLLEQYGEELELFEDVFTPEKIFSGWMFSSSPPLNALEHPVYDVWVLTCTKDK